MGSKYTNDKWPVFKGTCDNLTKMMMESMKKADDGKSATFVIPKELSDDMSLAQVFMVSKIEKTDGDKVSWSWTLHDRFKDGKLNANVSVRKINCDVADTKDSLLRVRTEGEKGGWATREEEDSCFSRSHKLAGDGAAVDLAKLPTFKNPFEDEGEDEGMSSGCIVVIIVAAIVVIAVVVVILMMVLKGGDEETSGSD